MNNIPSREQLQKIYLSLPFKLREVIFDVKTADKIYEIAQKYKLGSQKIPLLASEVGLVLLALVRIQNFINSLKERLKIDEPIAQTIAQEIHKEIFLPIKEELKKVYEEKPYEVPSTKVPKVEEIPYGKPERPVEVEKKPGVPAEEVVPEESQVPKPQPKKYEIAQIPEEEIEEEAELEEKPKERGVPESKRYELRTMKKDIERLKEEPAKPGPRIEGNIVDLKGNNNR